MGDEQVKPFLLSVAYAQQGPNVYTRRPGKNGLTYFCCSSQVYTFDLFCVYEMLDRNGLKQKNLKEGVNPKQNIKNVSQCEHKNCQE